MGGRNDHNYLNLVGWAGCMVGEAGLLWVSVSRIALWPVEGVAWVEAWLVLLPFARVAGVEAWEVARTTTQRRLPFLPPFLPPLQLVVSFCPATLYEGLPKVFSAFQGRKPYH